jgi:hypothetical protein
MQYLFLWNGDEWKTGNGGEKICTTPSKIIRRINGWRFQQIYQQIAVEFQKARANQFYITRNSFVLPHPPQP